MADSPDRKTASPPITLGGVEPDIYAAGGSASRSPSGGALEQNPAAVRRWLAETYPAIRAQARREGGVVLRPDEMGLRSDAAAGGRGRPRAGPGDQEDRQALPAQHDQRYLQRRDVAVRLFVGSFSGPVLIDFLRRLLRGDGQKVHLIVDGHPVHRARWSAPWVGRHADRIEPHFLPGYSPS